MNQYKSSDFKILMVDDLPKNLQVLGNTLKEENYQLEFATNGKSALKWLEKQDFDLVLLDVMMPGMDGYQVCTEIRKNPKFNDLPVIFLTAKTDNESILKGFETGGHDYITKPFDAKELLVRVKTHLQLAYSKKKLRNINTILEEKVAERTKQLKVANDDLVSKNIELNTLNKELSRLDIAKNEFLQLISHEIRTPLNGILGFLDLIKLEVESDELKDLFDSVDHSAKRLEEFSVQALQYTNLKVGTYELILTDCNLNEIIQDIIGLYNTEFVDKEFEVEINIEDTNCCVNADKLLLKSIMTYVIDNAYRFSPEGGKIIINATKSGDEKIIEVIDSGKGFSTKALKNLFKPFSPGQPHLDLHEGLGLAITKLVMDKHSGNVLVFNNEDGGATVKLIFP